MKERISWIDMAKGHVTLLVIYAHLGVDSLWSWMYSFHLPLFFFLSGYVFHGQKGFSDFIRKKCKAILVPYFCLGIPMVLFQLLKYIYTGRLSGQAAVQLVKDYLLQERFWTLWYLACLFCLNLLFYIIVKACRHEWLIALISIIMPVLGLYYYRQGGQPLPWNVDACAMAIPFFYAGYCYQRYGQNTKERVGRKIFAPVLFVIFAGLNLLCWQMSLDETGLGLEMFESNYGNPIFTYIAAFAGIACVLLVSKALVIPPIKYIGENSMLYYAWHQTIFIPIVQKVLGKVGIVYPVEGSLLEITFYKMLCLIVIVGLISVCNWMIKKFKWMWIVGK